MSTTQAPATEHTRMGRPVDHASTIERLEGDDREKARLLVVIDHLADRKTVDQACAELGIRRSRFFGLRAEVLQGALQALEPGTPGRPPKAEHAEDPEIVALREELRQMQIALEVARVQTLLAVTDPNLLDPAKLKAAAGKKGPRRVRSGTRRTQGPASRRR